MLSSDMLFSVTPFSADYLPTYRIRGLFGGDFNLAVWRITSESPNLSHAILKAIF